MSDDGKEMTETKSRIDPSSPDAASVDALIASMEDQLAAAGGLETGFFQVQFSDPRHFTWLLVAFASMGGLLSGLDQSLISGANLFLPKDLHLSARQNSLVNAGMPLGAVGGALLLSPANEYGGRKWAILLSILLYTVGAALEAGSINFGRVSAVCFFSVSRVKGSIFANAGGFSRDDCLWPCDSGPWCWSGGRHGSGLCG